MQNVININIIDAKFPTQRFYWTTGRLLTEPPTELKDVHIMIVRIFRPLTNNVAPQEIEYSLN